MSEGLTRSLEEKGVAVEGRRIVDQDLGLPDFSTEDSDTESEEFSAASCYSEEDGIVLTDNTKDTNTETHDNLTPVEVKSEKVRISLNFDNSADISAIENTDSSFNYQSALSLTGLDLHNSSDDGERLGCVNLDVTAMIAYVSSTANGGAKFVFQDKFLNEQAACERNNPVKKTLDGYFKGKNG